MNWGPWYGDQDASFTTVVLTYLLVVLRDHAATLIVWHKLAYQRCYCAANDLVCIRATENILLLATVLLRNCIKGWLWFSPSFSFLSSFGKYPHCPIYMHNAKCQLGRGALHCVLVVGVIYLLMLFYMHWTRRVGCFCGEPLFTLHLLYYVPPHSRPPYPMQLRSLCHSFHQVLSSRFPDEALDALGTVMFLRFINPALGNTLYGPFSQCQQMLKADHFCFSVCFSCCLCCVLQYSLCCFLFIAVFVFWILFNFSMNLIQNFHFILLTYFFGVGQDECRFHVTMCWWKHLKVQLRVLIFFWLWFFRRSSKLPPSEAPAVFWQACFLFLFWLNHCCIEHNTKTHLLLSYLPCWDEQCQFCILTSSLWDSCLCCWSVCR